MTTVDVVIPELSGGDAIGTHSLRLASLLETMGASVRFVVERQVENDRRVILLSDWKRPADLVIVQHGIGSMVAKEVIDRRLTCVVNYHNVTPNQFLEAWNPELVGGLQWGRQQTAAMAPLAQRGIADSEFNAAELRALGYRDVRVSPVLWDSDLLSASSDPTAAPNPAEPVVLFVGRIVPNKCQHDLIMALAVLREQVPGARLVLAGGVASDAYRRSLVALARRIGIADHVEFVGRSSRAELADWYRRASVFACLSEHEGFCVPLIEAMAFGVPVVAYAAAAVGETLGEAGILLTDKAPATVAAGLARVLSDDSARNALINAGNRRARHYSLDASREVMRRSLDGLLG